MKNDFESILKEQLGVAMYRENLDDIPQFSLPVNFTIRPFQPDDDKTWVNIQTAADHYNKFTLNNFQEQFGTDVSLLKERVRFLTDNENNAIGTTSAWFYDLEGKHYGLIHWVAIIPEWQGHGLAKPFMTTICNILKKLGHDKALLHTQSMRFPAIKLYYQFGFRPLIRDEKEQIAWDAILERIKADYRI